MPSTPSPLGHRIKTLREKKGWTQQQLAEKAGYQRAQTISNIERGRTLRSTDAYLESIAAALDTTVEFLRFGSADEILAAVQRPRTGAQSPDEKTVQPALTSERGADVQSASADAGSSTAPPGGEDVVSPIVVPSSSLECARYVANSIVQMPLALAQAFASAVALGTVQTWLTEEAEKRRRL